MHITEIVTRLNEIVGREVTVDGILLVGSDSRLVADPDKPDDVCILLAHPQVKKQLLQAVPPWGGGPYIYIEDATVVGVLSEGPLRLIPTRKLVVRHEKQVYEFIDLG